MFRLARPVRREQGSDANVTELALTSPDSWAESDVKGLLASKPVELDPAKDRAGPLATRGRARVHAGSRRQQRGGRLIVVGDSDWVRNRYVTQYYNGDLFLNMASWLTGTEEFATIDRKRPRVATVNLTLAQFANFRFLALFALPEAILLLGVVTGGAGRPEVSPRWTLGLLALAAALGAWVYFGEIRGAERKKEDETAAKRIFGVEPASVTALELRLPTGKSRGSCARGRVTGSSSLRSPIRPTRTPWSACCTRCRRSSRPRRSRPCPPTWRRSASATRARRCASSRAPASRKSCSSAA